MNEGLHGERLRKMRQWRGFSQEDLAQRVGSTQDQIARYETGRVQPNASMVSRLAKVLEVPSDYLLGLIEEPQFPHNLTDKERQLIEIARRLRD